MSHTYNNKNTPGGRLRTTGTEIPQSRSDKLKNGPRYNPPKQQDYNEQRRQSIAQLRVAERLAEEQQAVETGITDDSLTTQE